MAGVGRIWSAVASTVIKLTRLSVSSYQPTIPLLSNAVKTNYFSRLAPNSACIHTTGSLRGLSEFFDDEKNWNEREVKVGRSWRLDELRIKSNEDLHKLWYVLLKEKNMLLTMEHECKEECRLFPNPERIDKVEESMENLETVVRERNRAYWLLETGESGERPGAVVKDEFGMRTYRPFSEHTVPVWMNSYVVKNTIGRGGTAVRKFQRLMREQAFVKKRRTLRLMENHVAHLFRRFPDMDLEALQKSYPDVDVERIRKRKRARGNHSKNLG